MAKKNTLLTIALVGVGAYLLITAFRKKGGVKVTAENPIKQSADEYTADYAEVVSTAPAASAPTVLEKASSIFQTIFPKKTAEQKAAKSAKKATKKATKVAKKAAKKAKRVKGFDDISVLY